jgi:hypothetical protein
MTGGTSSRTAKPALKLTQVVRSPDDEEIERRPLEWGLIRRLFGYARPYRGTCIALAVLTVVRSVQLPLMVWAIGAVIGGPISRGDWPGTVSGGAAGFLALAFMTTVTYHFRYRLALQLGEAVVHDLRLTLFDHLLRLKLGFFSTTKLGRIIGRMTSDVESVRAGIQDVLFVSIVQFGQMLVAAVPDAVVRLDAVRRGAGARAGPLRAQPRLPRRHEPGHARGAGELQPRHRHPHRIGQWHPRHPGIRQAGRQRRACSAA